jgi:hypothetical protein
MARVFLVLDLFIKVEQVVGFVGQRLVEVELEPLGKGSRKFLSSFSGDLRAESRLTVTRLLWYSFLRN